VKKEFRQGDALSTIQFNIVFESVIINTEINLNTIIVTEQDNIQHMLD
jgi:hypothetical protein